MAAKLLQGWTLTDRYCPIQDCLTPLVRNKEKQLLCVDCDKWVVPESEVYAADSPLKEPPAPVPPQPETEAAASIAPPPVGRAEVCDRAIDVLLAKVDLCVAGLGQVARVPTKEATEMLEFLNTASKTILAMNDVKECVQLSSSRGR